VTVEVYGKPECVQCEYTCKKLAENGIDYNYHDATVEPEARQVVEASGRMQMPFVVAGDKSWHGFSPDKIRAIATAA